MSLRLRIEHGQDAGKTWRMSTAGVYTLGRTPENSIRILDMKVSKTHCEIRVADADGRTRAVLHDLGSTHGMTLNGQPVHKPMALKAGDELRLGLTIARILSDGEADTDARPIAGRDVDASAVASAGGPAEARTKTTLPPDALVGKTLGGYKIDRKIGAGGMGGVYLAEQISLNRKVALKVLNEKFASDSAFVDQFVNEARAAGALNHPNVVQVYDVGNDSGHYFFSMEVMPGGSIEDKVREGAVPWQEALNWFLDSANALIFAKRREILHRDVKPDNLMIGEDGSAKLCDLGLAKKSEVGDLMDQGIIGTPHFISPEAIRRKQDVDHRTDLYSLGCTFYRIFGGQNPYPAGTVKDILLGHLNKPVPHVTSINRDVPKEIDEVIYKLMQKDPEERIQTPEELLRELDKIRTQYNLEAHGIKPASRKPLVIALVAAILAIAGAGIFIATREEPQGGPGELSQDDLERIRQSERDTLRADLSRITGPATTALANLKLDLAQESLGPKNYTQSRWANLADTLKNRADEWQAQVDDWNAAAATEGDLVKQGHYTSAAAELTKLVDEARRVAREDIEAPIRRLEARAEARKEAIAAARTEAEAKIKAFAESLKKSLDQGDAAGVIAIEKALRKDEETKKNDLDRLVDALLAKELDGFSLLDADDLKPLLERYLPAGSKETRGEQALKDGLALLQKSYDALTQTIAAKTGDAATHEDLAAAIAALTEYLRTIPPGVDDPKLLAAAPQTVARLRDFRDKAKTARTEAQQADIKLRRAEEAADTRAYHGLLVALWRPGQGALQVFDFAAARASLEKATAAVKVPRFQQHVAAWGPRIDALERIFTHIVTSQASGAWVDDDYPYLDERGKERKGRIRGIDAKGVEWGKDRVGFAAVGARHLIEKLFFFEGKPRWGADTTAQDHHGLALLAELAGMYDLAQTQYDLARKAYGDAPEGALVADRIAQLAQNHERQASEKFWRIVEFQRQAGGWLSIWEPKAAASEGEGGKEPQPDAFPKEERGKVLDEADPFLRDIGAIWQMHAELGRMPLAETWIGSALLDEPAPGAKYPGGE